MIGWLIAESQYQKVQAVLGTLLSASFAYFLLEVYKTIKLDQGRVISKFNEKVLSLVGVSIGL